MLYIISDRYFLADFLLEEFSVHPVPGIDVGLPGHRRKKVLKTPGTEIARWREAFMKTPGGPYTRFFDREYTDALSRIGSEDEVLFFGVQNLKDLLILRKFIPARRVAVFLWNPVRAFSRNVFSRASYAVHLKKAGYEVYTFDGEDALRYGFHRMDQVYRRVDPEGPEAAGTSCSDGIPCADLFFVGQDKHRARVLSQVKRAADTQGLNCDFYILPDKHTRPCPELSPYMRSEPMPYSETLRHIGRSRALVEILQPGQDGSSLRAMEALFLGKKLITDNLSYRNSPVYHPDNVFIWGEDETARLREFVYSPLYEWPRETVDRYDIRCWIRNFCK